MPCASNNDAAKSIIHELKWNCATELLHQNFPKQINRDPHSLHTCVFTSELSLFELKTRFSDAEKLLWSERDQWDPSQNHSPCFNASSVFEIWIVREHKHVSHFYQRLPKLVKNTLYKAWGCCPGVSQANGEFSLCAFAELPTKGEQHHSYSPGVAGFYRRHKIQLLLDVLNV